MDTLATKFLSNLVPRQPTQRWLWAWGVLCCSLLFAAMAVPFWWGKVYVADDLGAFHLPLRDFYARQLARGQAWDWMPSLFCGFYVSGEGQLGGYHPLHWLLYRTLPLGAAFNLELLLSYPLMALGMYVLLCRLLARRDAAVFGGMLFAFCGFNLLHFVHPNAVAVIAHVPWLVWLVDIACRSGKAAQRRWACAGIALATGSQLLLGYPQYVWFSWLVAGIWIVARLPWHTAWQRGLPLAAAFAVGVILGGVQLLPTIEMLLHSSRSHVESSFANTGSLHPLNLLQPFAPYVFQTRVVGQNTHELTCYLGAVPLVLCAWLWLNRRELTRRERTIAGLAVTLAVLSLLYALGEYGPLSWLLTHLPAVNRFRFPARAIFISQFAVALVAAVAIGRLSKFIGEPKADHLAAVPAPGVCGTLSNATNPSLARRANRLWCLPLISLVTSLAVWYYFHEHARGLLWVVVGPALIALTVVLVNRICAGSRYAMVGLILLTAFDLAAYGMSYAVWSRTSDLNRFVANLDHPPYADAAGRLLVDDRDPDSPLRAGNQLLMLGYSLADGYAGLEPPRLRSDSHDQFARRAGVQWRKDQATWRRVPSPAPYVQLSHEQGLAKLVAHRPGQIVFDVEASQPTTVTVAESYFPGWLSASDGSNLPLSADEDGLMRMTVPAGMHRIELNFSPASLRWGKRMSLCGLGLLVAWCAMAWVPRHSSRSGTCKSSDEIATPSTIRSEFLRIQLPK